MQNDSSHPLFFLTSNNNSSSFRQCFLSASLLQTCRVFMGRKCSREFPSTLTSMWGRVVCVRLCIDTHPCVVCTCTPHMHVCYMCHVLCMLSSLCVPMSHAYDWMHTSMSLCVHICRHVSMCVYVYMYVLYPLVHSIWHLGLTWAMHFPW